MNRILQFPVRHRWPVIAVFAAVCVVMGLGAMHLRVDASIDSFYPNDNPVVRKGREIQARYNTGKAVIAVVFADNVLSPESLTSIRSITEKLGSLDGVLRVNSLTNTKRMTESDGMLVTGDMLPPGDPGPADIAGIERYLATSYAMQDGLFVAKDRKSAAIITRFDPALDETRMCRLIETTITEGWPGRVEMTGVPVLGSAILTVIRGVPLLALLSLGVILLFLALNFRSVLGVLLPLVQLLVGLLWGVGFLGWLKVDFLALMAIGPIAILAVGSSFSLHLLGRYYLEISLGKDKETAVRAMLTETGLGVFVSGLAISASMLTFLLSGLQMIRGMGLLTAVGVFSCMISSLTLLPALLMILPAPRVNGKRFGNGGLSVPLRGLGRAVGRHPKRILLISGALVLVAIVGVFRIVPDTSIAAYFSRSSAAIRGMQAVEKTLGGSTQITMLVDGDLQDPELLKSMLRFQESARAIPGVGSAQSLATTVRTLHETLTGEKGMPSSRELVSQELLLYQSSGSVDDMTSMANLDYTEGLITIIARNNSSHDTKIMISRIEKLAGETIGNKARTEITGDSMVLSILEEMVLRDFIISLTLAIFIVVCIDSLIRSLRAALVTIIVLIFTIALQYGVLGLFGMTFTMATALLGALATGIGDYAIHFTVRYMEDRRRGLAPERAIEEAIATSGRSILFTSLTLGGGFAALVFSQFVPVADLGKLMVFTVIAVGVASLTLLPAACLVFLRNPNSRMEVSR